MTDPAFRSLYLSVSAIAEHRGLSERTIRKAIRAGLLRAEHVGGQGPGHYRVTLGDYVDWVRNGAPTTVREEDSLS